MIGSSKSHLKEVDETYFEHQGVALRYALKCLKAAMMAFMHGLIPGCFKTGASDIVNSLARNRKKAD